MKSTMTQSIVLKNNRDILIQSDIEPYQLYVNQYYIEHELSDAVKITKHYYMGAQKIASDAGFGPPRIVDPNFFTGVVLDNLNDALDVLDKAPIDLPLDGPLETVEDLFGELRQFEVSTITLPAQTRPRLLYWYHPDYIGNVDLITDADGEAYQFFMYNAWGENLYDWQSNTGDYNSPYRFNGKELDPETGNYYYGARYYNPKISVWLSVDPLAHKFPHLSPYNFTENNPIMLLDPDGRSSSPIYDLDGNFLGTDDQGLQGEALVMLPEDFSQGMSHAEAKDKNLGLSALHLDNNGVFQGDSGGLDYDRLTEHNNGLSDRPDYDGFVTREEGIEWAKNHVGALEDPNPDNRLYINSSLLDFGNISKSQFNEIDEITPVNLFNMTNLKNSRTNARLRHTVYALGRVNMIHHGEGVVSIVNDAATNYDWNRGGSLKRRAFINTERRLNGLNDSHGFEVKYYGRGRLNQ